MEFLIIHFFFKNDHMHFIDEHRSQGIKWVGETFFRLYFYPVMWPWQICLISYKAIVKIKMIWEKFEP